MRKIVFALIAVCVLLSGCQGKKEDVIKVGVIIPLTGGYSDVGNWMRMGITLAVEDLNKQHNINFQPIYEDSQSSPQIAIASYQKINAIQQVDYYISTVSSVCLALKPIIENDNNFMFVNAGHKDLIDTTKAIPDIYRHALTISQEALFLASNVNRVIDNDAKIALLYTNNDIGVEFNNVFSNQFKDNTIFSMAYEEAETNLKLIVHKLLSNNPDVFVIYGYTKNFAPLIKTIRELGYDKQIYANQGFSTPSVFENVGSSGNNVFYSDYDIVANPHLNELNQRSITLFGEPLSAMGITSYNIMYALGSLAVESTEIELFKQKFSKIDTLTINNIDLYINKGEVYVPLKLMEYKYNDK